MIERTPRPRRRAAIAALALGTLATALTACGSDSETTSATSTEPAAAGGVDLSGVCPSTVVIQTDWNPQSEQGGLFNLLGPDAKIDADKKVTTGSLYSQGKATGVNLEIRAGGPAIGFTGVPAQMYTDKDILLGWVNSDEAISHAADTPTTSVLATFEKAPWMVMWDPATYPEVHSIADLGKTDAAVRYFAGTTYMDYLVGSGQLRKEQVDGSYDGTPAGFVAAQGKDGQQGFATVEPWVYENDIKEWNKPVDYQLVADTGYPIYAVALSARTADITGESDCLKQLVPVIQQSTIDFFAAPEKANELIVKAVEAYNTGWIYPAGEAENSVKEQIALKVVANGPDGTFGSFDTARLQQNIDIAGPILTKAGQKVPSDIAPEDLATNEFLDPTIALPAS